MQVASPPFALPNFLASPQLSQDNNNTTTPQHHHRPRTLAPASNEASNHERVTTVHCERESPLINEQFFFFVVGQLNLFSTSPPLKRKQDHQATARHAAHHRRLPVPPGAA